MDHACLLFAGVLITTTLSGAVIRMPCLPIRDWRLDTLSVPSGRPVVFAALLAILLCHELGHYLRRDAISQRVAALLHPRPRPLGDRTFGAFIRLRTIVNDPASCWMSGPRPIAGFLVVLPILWIGLHIPRDNRCAVTAWSTVGGPADAPRRFGRDLARPPVWCGTRRADAHPVPSPGGSACS